MNLQCVYVVVRVRKKTGCPPLLSLKKIANTQTKRRTVYSLIACL